MNQTLAHNPVCLRKVLVVGLSALLGSSVAAGDQPNINRPYAKWVSSFESAVEQSRQTGRPIMLVFTGSDWCESCNRLSDEVYRTHEFARWTTRHVIKVEVDFPRNFRLPAGIQKQNQKLKDRFRQHVESMPTVLFVTADGQVIGKMGYVQGGPKNWIRHASTIVNPRPGSDLVARSEFPLLR